VFKFSHSAIVLASFLASTSVAFAQEPRDQPPYPRYADSDSSPYIVPLSSREIGHGPVLPFTGEEAKAPRQSLPPSFSTRVFANAEIASPWDVFLVMTVGRYVDAGAQRRNQNSH
jgi:hypothetical protein